MGKLICCLLLSALVTGCASSFEKFNPPDSFYTAQTARIEAIKELKAKPLVKIKGEWSCPPSENCEIVVNNPNAADDIPEIVRGVGAADVAISAIQGVQSITTTGIKYTLGYKAVSAVVDRIGDRTNNIDVQGEGHSVDLREDYKEVESSVTTMEHSEENEIDGTVVEGGQTISGDSADSVDSHDTEGSYNPGPVTTETVTTTESSETHTEGSNNSEESTTTATTNQTTYLAPEVEGGGDES